MLMSEKESIQFCDEELPPWVEVGPCFGDVLEGSDRLAVTMLPGLTVTGIEMGGLGRSSYHA